MLADRIEAKWIDAFCEIFERCAVKSGDTAAILSETQSRALNVHLAELALLRMGARPFHVIVPTPRNRQIVPIRSTGASVAIQRLAPVVTALQQAGFVVDCTVEGLMHAAETPEILKAGARILVISNEHPEALERMVPDTALEKRVRAAAKMLRGTMLMRAYLAAWGDREAYAVSHVGFGMNPSARYEALAMYDQRDTNGTELRAVAGNFLFSTGANEFAGRYTSGHFDLPMMGTTIELDGVAVVREGVLQDVFG